MRPLVLGGRQYLYLTVTLILTGLLISWGVFHPALYHRWCIEYYIPRVQDRFGFRAARTVVRGLPYEPLTLVYIAPGGPLARAGFRVGDIPVDHHGGETAFCG